MAPSYAADHVGPFFSVAFEAEVGEKKPRPSRWRNCGGYSKSCCPGGRIGLPTSWRLSPGGSGAITVPICPRKNGERPKAKASAFRRPPVADRHLSWMQQPNGAQCPPCLSDGGVGLPQGEVIGPAPRPPCRLVDGA